MAVEKTYDGPIRALEFLLQLIEKIWSNEISIGRTVGALILCGNELGDRLDAIFNGSHHHSTTFVRIRFLRNLFDFLNIRRF